MSNELRGDQLAPYSVEAEEAVLGSILINPEALFAVMPFLSSDSFFIERHGWIYEAMLALNERHEPYDYLTTVAELEQAGRLPEIGGASYVLSLVNKTPSALNVEGYGRIVERMAFRRNLLDAAQTVARLAHSAETEIMDVATKSERAILDVVATQKRATRITAAEANRRRDEQDGRNGQVLLTAFEDIDQLTDHRIRFGRSLHILACSEHLKTTLATELLIEWALMGYRTLYVSMENEPSDITDQMGRYLAWSRRITVQEADKMVNDSGLELISGRQTARDIESHIMSMSYGGQVPGIVVVDTMQKLLDCDKGRGRDASGVAAGSAALDGARLNTGWLWVVLCQQYVDTNERDVKKLRPGRGNVMDSKAIFHDARIMIGGYYADAWRHDLGDGWDDPGCGENEYLLKCIKNSFGNKRALPYVKMAVVPGIPAVVPMSKIAPPVQKTFATASYKGNGDGGR